MDQALADLATALETRLLAPMPRPEVTHPGTTFPVAASDVSQALTLPVFASVAQRSAMAMEYAMEQARALIGQRKEGGRPGKAGILQVVMQINYIIMRFPQFTALQQQDAFCLCEDLFAEKKHRDIVLERGRTPEGDKLFSDDLLANSWNVAGQAVNSSDPDFIHLTAFYMNSRRPTATPLELGQMVEAYDGILQFVGEHSGIHALALLEFTGLTRHRVLSDDEQVMRMMPHVTGAIKMDPEKTFQILGNYALRAALNDVQQETSLANHLELVFPKIPPVLVSALATAILTVRKDSPLAAMAAWYEESGERQRPLTPPRVLRSLARERNGMNGAGHPSSTGRRLLAFLGKPLG